MNRRNRVRVTVLVEDRALERLARGILLLLGCQRRDISVEGYPVGHGSAKQWVEKEFPRVVKEYRGKGREQVALLVATEADQQTITQRLNCLATTLADEKLPARDDHERIALWIPKWNVETWILSLLGNDIDEDHNYKHKVKKPDYKALAEAFVTRMRDFHNRETESLPSLEIAFKETSRMKL